MNEKVVKNADTFNCDNIDLIKPHFLWPKTCEYVNFVALALPGLLILRSDVEVTRRCTIKTLCISREAWWQIGMSSASGSEGTWFKTLIKTLKISIFKIQIIPHIVCVYFWLETMLSWV